MDMECQVLINHFNFFYTSCYKNKNIAYISKAFRTVQLAALLGCQAQVLRKNRRKKTVLCVTHNI